MNVQIPLEILGTEVIADVEFRITAKSKKASRPSFNDPGSPPEGCEFEVDSITVKGEPVPRWLFIAISRSDELGDAISEAESEDNYYGGQDPDFEHDRRSSGD